MAIPKQIFQTFKIQDLPWITRWYIKKMLRKNPEYEYHFYDDVQIQEFLMAEYPVRYLNAYKRLTIGAAKADFFRYAILYKKGGIYLDIDSGIKSPFKDFILDSDEAIITREGNPGLYVQWALIFNKEHPFLEKTLASMLDNIETHRFPNDVHQTTGPTVFTKAVNESLRENPNIVHRFLGTDWNGHLQFKYKLGKFFLYSKKSEHWKQKQKTQDIIKPAEQ